MQKKKILIIYPETRATRIAIYRNTDPMFLKTIRHPQEELDTFDTIPDQTEYRKQVIFEELKRNDFDLSNIEIIMARSGLVKPLKSGVYEINDKMFADLETGIMGVHETNLGGMIAYKMANELGIKAYMADPVVVMACSDHLL